MIRQGSGVILTFGGNGGREAIRDYYIGGTQVAIGAIDVLRRQLAAELGPHGIVTLQSSGVPETIPDDFDERDAIVEMIVGATMLGRAVTFEDVGNVAAFAASDLIRTITGTNINITSGAVAD
jgi:enoyl-[acyl-carrier-protein] reductase (NADH)